MHHRLAVPVALAASLAGLGSAAGQVIPTDSFEVSLTAVTSNGTDGGITLDETATFGTPDVFTDVFGNSVTVSTSQTFDGTAGTITLIVSTPTALIPAGTRFDAGVPVAAPAGDIVTDLFLDIGALAGPNGFNFVSAVDAATVQAQYFATAGGIEIGPLPFDEVGADFGVAPDGSELQLFAGVGTFPDDLGDASLNALRVEITYEVIPEPAALAILPVAGTLLRRRR